MPKLAEFDGFAMDYAIRAKAVAATAVSAALDAGAAYMREYIAGGSPTGSSWHDLKNEANGYPAGSRMGNTNPALGATHADAGNMFRSVQAEDARVTSDTISGRFGWIGNQQDYFLQQDSGHYKVGKQTGMGLLNKAERSSKGVLQEIGAAVAAEEKLRSEARAGGFKITGGGSWS